MLQYLQKVDIFDLLLNGAKRPRTKVMRPGIALGPCKPARHAHQAGHDGRNRRTQANDDHLGLWNLAKRHPQGADPPGHGILRGTGVSQQSTAAKPAKHSSTARKNAKQLSYTKHTNPTPLPSPSLLLPLPPMKTPPTRQNPQQPAKTRNNP